MRLIIVYIIFLMFFCGNLLGNEVDSLVLIAEKQAGKNRVETLIEIAKKLRKSDSDKSIGYAKQAVISAQKIGNVDLEGEALYYIGVAYYYKQEFDKSLSFYNKALDKRQISGDSVKLAKNLHSIGLLYYRKSNYEEALIYYQKSLKLKERLGLKQEIAKTTNTIGIVYMEIEKFDDALTYFEQSLEINKEIENIVGTGSCLHNMGMIYRKKGDYKKAKQYFEEAKMMSDNVGYRQGVALANNMLGITYRDMNEFEVSIKFLEDAMNIYNEINDQLGVSMVLGSLGDVCHRQGDYKKSMDYYKKSLGIARKIGNLDYVGKSYSGLAQVSDSLGNYKDAFFYFQKYIDVRDSISSTEIEKNIQELQTKYQTEKKEQENEFLKELNEKQKRSFIAIVLGGSLVLILILVIAIILYRGRQRMKRANLLLNRQNIEINTQKDEIQTQAKELETKNIELEKLSIVASETDNSVMIADENADIEWVNAGFTRLFGFTLEEYFKERGRNAIETSSNPNIRKILEDSLENKKSIVYTSKSMTKSGGLIWTQTTLTPILNEQGKLTKLVAIDSDITKIKEVEAEIEAQRNIAVQQRDQIAEQQKHIMDSIHYAKRIQTALLPKEDYVQEIFPNNFILFKPRDIVSGDFYWIGQKEGKSFAVAADCTGHGVPGAFMSMLGMTFLNEIVNDRGFTEVDVILNELRFSIIRALGQTGQEGEAQDGMDLAMIAIDERTNQVEFAGANNSLYVVRNQDVVEYKADRMPIGIYHKQDPFTKHKFQGKIGDQLYIFSDGYVDQFGGPKGKKLLAKRFKKILLQNSLSKIHEQKELLNSTLIEWQGNHEQVDDIIVMGIKL